MKKLPVRVAAFLLCLILLLPPALGCAAQADTGRVVRVGYPIQPGLTELDVNGNYTGYTYEYLEEVAQYTGWDYEFVQVPGTLNESLTAMMEMLEAGELDLMGGMYYSDALGEIYNYSSHNYGTGETVLRVLYDQPGEVVLNSQVQQTLRVAMIEGASRTRQEFESFCQMNLITPEYVLCQTDDELLQALRDGRADALLNSSMNSMEGVRTIARFAPKPFYFVAPRTGDTKLMEELNTAMINIEQTDPNFTATLFSKYFSPQNDVFLLTQAESEYIDRAEPLRVGVLVSQPPFQYVDQETGEAHGISMDLLSYISEKTGLQFEFVPAQTQESLYRLVGEQQVDLVAGMPYNYDEARERHLSMTRPFLSSQYLLLMKESLSENSIRGKRLALLGASTYRGEFVGKVQYYETTEDCIRAVADGDADYTYVDAYTAQYYFNMPEYHDLKLVPQTYAPRKICLGVTKPADRELLSILNKSIVTISEVDIQAMINQNVIVPRSFTISDYLRQNPVESFFLLAAVSLLVIAVLVFFLYQRAKAGKRSALELEKHMRVYALANDYFIEYDYKKNTAFVTVPPKEGMGKPQLLEYDCNKKIPDTQENPQWERFMKLLCSQEDGVREVHLACIDGREHWLRLALETVYDGDVPVYALGKITIIDEEKRERETLLEKSQLDSLTQIYNAAASRQTVERELAALRPGQSGALLLVDIDHFKSVNDTYGHLEGDQTLQRLAALLRGSFRAGDVVGRPGGDEFLVYLCTLRSREALEEKCEQLCKKVHGVTLSDGKHLTVSMGAAMAACGSEYDQLYRAADRALYRAKELGRDGFAIAGD